MVLFLEVFVLYVFSECLLFGFRLFEFLPVLLPHRLDHIVELLYVGVVRSLHVHSFHVELVFEDGDIAGKLLLQPSHPGVLH